MGMQSTHCPVPDMGQAIMPDRYIISCCCCAAEHQSLAITVGAFAVAESKSVKRIRMQGPSAADRAAGWDSTHKSS